MPKDSCRGDGPVEETVLRELMLRYQNGELTAFDILHSTLSPELRRFLLRKCACTDRADELVQETFLQIHRSRDRYHPDRDVRPWVFAIARFVYLMNERARRRRQRVLLPPREETPEPAIPARAQGIADRLFLEVHVAKVPESQREPLLLHHLRGFSFAEIARALGLTEGAAKVRAHRALKELRRSAAESLDLPETA